MKGVPSGRVPVSDEIVQAARELFKKPGPDRNRLSRIIFGEVKSVEVEWWRAVNGVARYQAIKAQEKKFKGKLARIKAMADPALNPNEHQRKVAETMLAKAEAAGPAKAPHISAPGLEEYDREEAWFLAAMARENARMDAVFKAATAARRDGATQNTSTKLLLNTTKPRAAAGTKPKPEPPLNTTKKPRSADRHKEPNRDRHSPGYMREYMREYMRRRRAKRD
jgi:hypothetical protein